MTNLAFKINTHCQAAQTKAWQDYGCPYVQQKRLKNLLTRKYIVPRLLIVQNCRRNATMSV